MLQSIEAKLLEPFEAACGSQGARDGPQQLSAHRRPQPAAFAICRRASSTPVELNGVPAKMASISTMAVIDAMPKDTPSPLV